MPKKFTLIPTLTALSISTLGALVPMSAYATDYYHVPELADIHARYVEAISRCDESSDDSTLSTCYANTRGQFQDTYGGLFKAMMVLDTSDKMMVSAFNPTAGTARFYVSETDLYGKPIFNLESLVVFWADDGATPSPYWNDEAAWEFVDTVLVGNPTPDGYHILYKGKKDDDSWISPNVENRVTFDDDGDFIVDNGPRYFFVMGYDTAGEKHMQKTTYWGCTDEDFSNGGECRLQYEYSAEYDVAAYSYTKADAPTEDATLAELKKAIRMTEQAEADARQAELDARQAEADAREAENNAKEAKAKAAEENSKLATDAIKRTEEAILKITELQAKITELQTKIAELSSKITQSPTIEYITYTGNISKSSSDSKNTPEVGSQLAKEATSSDDSISIPLVGGVDESKNELKDGGEFPWWFIVFVFSGIALILWWFIPFEKKSSKTKKL